MMSLQYTIVLVGDNDIPLAHVSGESTDRRTVQIAVDYILEDRKHQASGLRLVPSPEN